MGIAARIFKVPVERCFVCIQMDANYLALLANHIKSGVEIKFI